MRRCAPLGPLGLLCATLLGCARSPDPATTFTINDAEYEQTFSAARDVLRDAGFILDRVDAQRGIITTHPRPSSGMATPWIDHASSPGDAAAATLHRERRFATVRFARSTDPTAQPDAASIDADVEVFIQRLGAPGRKPEPSSIRMTSRWTEGSRGNGPATPFDAISERPDDRLAAELAARIRARATDAQ